MAARVESDPLADVAVDTTGAITFADGAFPSEIWRDTPRPLVDALLPRLPVATSSPALRSLMRRLLLSAAALPPGEGEPGRLLEQRVRLLWRMNDFDGLFRLVAAVPADARSSPLMRLDTEARLLSGDIDGACATAQSRIAEDVDLFWQQVIGFCQKVHGSADEAALTVALLAEHGRDPGFYPALLAAIPKGAGTSGVPPLREPTPLELAMLRAAGISPAPEAADAGDLPLLAAIAGSEAFALPLRVTAGERAVAAGAFPANALLALHAQVPAANPGASKASDDGGQDVPLSIPAAVLALALDPSAASRAEGSARVLADARENGQWLQAVRLLAPLLAAADPAGEATSVGRELVPALLVLGQRERADVWLRALSDQTGTRPEAAAAAQALRPFARLAGTAQARSGDADDLAGWCRTETTRTGGRARVERMLVLLQATGEPVPATLWDGLLEGPAQTNGTFIDAAFRAQILRAAAGGRLGETVLLVLVASGAEGPQALADASLGVMVESLRAVGLEADARAYAVEAASAR